MGDPCSFATRPVPGTTTMLEAAEALRADDACLLYVVSRQPDDPEAVWVTEA
jgi:quinol monooxygenase YgiN